MKMKFDKFSNDFRMDSAWESLILIFVDQVSLECWESMDMKFINMIRSNHSIFANSNNGSAILH